MIYDKFTVVMLSAINSMDADSTNAIIAKYILENRDKVKDIGIKELAERTHVGTGSISRFCRAIGLFDFFELKALINDFNPSIDDKLNDMPFDERMVAWHKKVSDSISKDMLKVNQKKISLLCKDIEKYDKVSAFGLLKAESAAINLQVDLMPFHKQIYTAVSIADQFSHIVSSDENTLIIIFSYTGSYFDYSDVRAHVSDLKKPKIWMICSTDTELPPFVNDTIRFNSSHELCTHPYQLEAIESMIALEYTSLYFSK